MALSMYSSSVPLFIKYLNNLSAILKKGEDHAAERKIEDRVLTGARLFPDMFPLSRQVQIACDTAKGCGARLAGGEMPSFEDKETTFAELRERVAKTVAFLQSLPEEKFADCEAREIKLKAGPYELEFIGVDYLTTWALPNFYFHLTTAYNLLRHNGVPVGKMDFLGR